MHYTKIFPSVLIFLDLCASVAYFVAGNYRMSLYWFSAAVLSACVTY